MGKYAVDNEKYAALARRAVAEGCVLVKNENQTLPLRRGDKVAVFGRMAFHYYKSGLGSGGLVNTRYVVSVLDALKKETEISLDENVLQVYENWIKEHPYDAGAGWGLVPWSQEEMPLDDAVIAAAADDDIALVMIGRTAGEDQDNANESGSYLLTDVEREMIAKVSRKFKRTAVILNVGNIIDMKWAEELQPSAVLYAWQGGQEGGNGVCDVLTGRVNPCGKLTDTIAERIEDYPCTANFGDAKRNYYKEDIYVGYRYFETFAKDKVIYPFGYGLSYTTFSMESAFAEQKDSMEVKTTVKNTGDLAGKEVVQVYIEAPQVALDKPARVLAGFAKTKELAPGEEQTVTITIPKSAYASYDDTGATGHKDCFLLEAGMYGIYVGADVRSAERVAEYEQELLVIEELEEVCAPAESYERMTRAKDGRLTYTQVPKRTFGPYDRIEEIPAIAYTGDRGYKLADVYHDKITMDEFIAQLSDEDLMMLFRGEGMCSPKVTPGTGSAFGGLTESLRGFGIPATCTTDGPSGLRLDCGTKAFSLPNGTSLGCTFNLELVEKLYEMTGLELRKNRVDALLGPGLNIHRSPLNGRNFEYISEDPLLTGKMGAAQIIGLGIVGSTGTIKHFSTNNQEAHRREVDAVVSVRALREIYFKGYEISIKEGRARSVMTTYGPMNGLWTAGNYDLNTIVLRKDWGFEGIVMSDWWAAANTEGEPSNMKNHAAMVMAQNDLYMVTSDASDQTQDNLAEALADGRITRGQLQRNAGNILGFILKSPAMLYEMDMISEEELEDRKGDTEEDAAIDDIIYYESDANGDVYIPGKDWDTRMGSAIVFGINAESAEYDIEITARSPLGELSQLPITLYYDNGFKEMISFRGSEGEWFTDKRDFGTVFGPCHYIKIYFGATGLEIDNITLRYRKRVPVFED